METFSALLTLCAGNSSITGEFTSQRQETRSFDVFFDLRMNNREVGDVGSHCAHYDVIVMIIVDSSSEHPYLSTILCPPEIHVHIIL